MPVVVTLPGDVVLAKTLVIGACTHPAGHCYGSDGGSGLPDNLKVAQGRGGEQRAWTLSADSSTVLSKEWYARCQFCLKYQFVETEDQRNGQTDKT